LFTSKYRNTKVTRLADVRERTQYRRRTAAKRDFEAGLIDGLRAVTACKYKYKSALKLPPSLLSYPSIVNASWGVCFMSGCVHWRAESHIIYVVIIATDNDIPKGRKVGCGKGLSLPADQRIFSQQHFDLPGAKSWRKK